MNKAELNFINEMTRKLLAGWCLYDIQAGMAPEQTKGLLFSEGYAEPMKVYIEHAKKKGWLSADGKRVLAAGFNTAAAFLRR